MVTRELWDRIMEDHRDTSEHHLRREAEDHLADVDCEAIAIAGVPEEVIPELARERNVSLIVMASRGQNLASKIFIGSTTDRVLRAARCPVLIVKPDDD